MARGQHDTGRIHRAPHHPAFETGGRGRHRRIPAEQDRDVRMIRIQTLFVVFCVLVCWFARLADVEAVVRPILDAVRKYGDKALLEYARKFDGLTAKSVRVSESDLRAAAKRLSPAFRSAVDVASANVRRYAEKQLPKESSSSFGACHQLGQIVRPLDTIGAYIPAGRYPLPSTLIMTAVPAIDAGVA